jgi:hypothetical protein
MGVEPRVTLERPRSMAAQGRPIAVQQTLTVPSGATVNALLCGYESQVPEGEQLTVDIVASQQVLSNGVGIGIGAATFGKVIYDVNTNGGSYREVLPFPCCGIRRRITAKAVRISVTYTNPVAAVYKPTYLATVTRGYATPDLNLASLQPPDLNSATPVDVVVPRFTTEWRIVNPVSGQSGVFSLLTSDAAGSVASGALTQYPDSLAQDWQPWPATVDVLRHVWTGIPASIGLITAAFRVGG